MKFFTSCFCLLAGAVTAFSAGLNRPPLSQEVYVWQRAWTSPVGDAVAAHATNFSEVVVLSAEVSWRKQQPNTVRVAVDFSTLVKAHCPVGLALRVGPYKGELSQNSTNVNFLAGLAASLVAEARTNQIEPVELQLDFDCAESKLDDYRLWFTQIQQRVAPLPVTITALPSWLNSALFPALAAAATNYVLQVHSLEKPVNINQPFSLCDPATAKRTVERAGKIGVPFRVALPTYTYLVAFNTNGNFVGLAAEAPKASWPAGTQVRELSADPLAMSALVQGWNANRPAALGGVIWYRLPTIVDNLNWRWPTLGAIVAARVPQEKFSATARRVEPRLMEISLENTGDLDITSRLAVAVHWSGARLIAGDGLRDFELADSNDSAATFQNQSSLFRLRAGDHIVIGWLRFDQNHEVTCEVKKF